MTEIYIRRNTTYYLLMPKKNKKIHVNFYLEKEIIEEIDLLVNDPKNIFDDRSKIIRYCVKMTLPKIKDELEHDKR